MLYKALVSFSGNISMAGDEVREISDQTLANDLTKAGYIIPLDAAKKEKPKADPNEETEEKPKPRRKGKKDGNSITINHKNGYVTKYNNLGDILVRQGQKVTQGTVIGRVGMSGMSFAPHLHYEVWLNDEMMDPMNYFFATLTPQMFREMAVVVANTGQSLD